MLGEVKFLVEGTFKMKFEGVKRTDLVWGFRLFGRFKK
jgi:hypothetical protein